MASSQYTKRWYAFLLVFGDTILFYVALYFSFVIRHQSFFLGETWDLIFLVFTPLLILWILLLFVGDFYETKQKYLSTETVSVLLSLWVVWWVLSLIYFYFSPPAISSDFKPKSILLLDAAFLLGLFVAWRFIATQSVKLSPIRFSIIGEHPQIPELLSEIQERFKTVYHYVEIPRGAPTAEFLRQKKIQLIVVGNHAHGVNEWIDILFPEIPTLHIRLEPFTVFFENITKKIPLFAIDKAWFLEHLDERRKQMFDRLKRIFDTILAAFAILLFTPVALFIALILFLEGKTKVFYSQIRLGKNGKTFRIYKFASMPPEAEWNGPQWSKDQDPRVTAFGKFLRRFHLDELPQLINILKGEMGFVGPRPERPEFISHLEKKIPFYRERLFVRPGLSGWAQINYPYGSSEEDALKKLQYDLYYVKHRSFLLDAEVILKTARIIFR